MISNSNTFNAIEMTSADLDCVSGGTDAVLVNPWLKIEQQLEAAYQKSHPIQLGPFPTPHTAVPHF